jgi:hypothetical protein
MTLSELVKAVDSGEIDLPKGVNLEELSLSELAEALDSGEVNSSKGSKGRSGMSMSEWAEALNSGEIELSDKWKKRGRDASYGLTIVAEFHPTKNGDLTPHTVSAHRNSKLWWKCSDSSCPVSGGHEWESTGATRASQGAGCPACSGSALIVGLNDMGTTHPELTAEWHPTKNGDLTPQDFQAATMTKIWWKCSDSNCPVSGGHEWEARGSARASNGSGCPACGGHALVKGHNDLATTYPELVADWHPTKNGDLTPQDVRAGAQAKVWWKHSDPNCVDPEGYEWEAVCDRVVTTAKKGNQPCPACNGMGVVVGVNDLATTHPEVAADWHPTKNDFLPTEVKATKGRVRVWWKHADPDCNVEGGHEWEALITNRTGRGSGCPACAKNGSRFAVKGLNDLATVHPDLAADWHPTKNEFAADEVRAGSNRRVWWKHSDPNCKVPGGYEWEAQINGRVTSGSGCSACNRGWYIPEVKAFIVSMIEGGHISSLTQAEMYTLAQQNGLLRSRTVGDAIAGLASGKAISDFADSLDDADDAMAAAMADPEAFADHVLSNVSDEDMDDEGSFEDTEVTDADMTVVSNDGYQDNDPSTDALPGQVVEQTLRTADAVFAQVDEEMMEYFIAARLHALWTQAYKDPEAALAAAEAYRSCDA